MEKNNLMRATVAVTLLLTVSVVAAPETHLLFENSDFEKGTLENWSAEGNAFGSQPTKGDNPAKRGRMDGSKHQGNYWIGTFESFTGKGGRAGDSQGDGPTGRLTSKEFTIRHHFINFIVGAGPHLETSVRLWVDGKTYLLASGPSSETMRPVSTDVTAFQGKSAQLVILDNATGGWGHINADYFTGSDEPLTKATKPLETKKADLKRPIQGGAGKGKPLPLTGPEQSAEITISKNFLLFPIRDGAPVPWVSLSLDGKEVRYFQTAELATSADDISWWAFEDVSEYVGKKGVLAVGGISEAGFKLIRQSDTVPGQEKWGGEALRPQFHFSQKVGWNNDPNGMVYYDGEWHLYLQHNPVGWKWGNMTWAHGVTKDLVHWRQLPNVLHHRQKDAMFSGGGAVDWKNTGGWKTGENDVVFVTWTSTGRGECIAYSNDKGRSFTEYQGNPIIEHKGRDPKPFWYSYGDNDKPLSEAAAKLGGHWVIAVYDEDQEHGRNISIYTSINLREWELRSKLPGYYECAEVFSLPVDGDKGKVLWVIFAADARYAVGSFDGKVFTPEHEGKHQLHWGPFYASQLFSDAPGGRRIQIGWARIPMPGMPFNQTFTFPTELSLKTTAEGVRMFGEPVAEIGKIHGKKHSAGNRELSEEQTVDLATSGALFDIRASFEVGTAKRVGLDVDGQTAFAYDVESGKCDGHDLKLADGRISVQILIDRPMIETFVNQGQMVITAPYENDLNLESIQAFAKGGVAKLVSLEVYELDASWQGKSSRLGE